MKIRREPLHLISAEYSREYGVERSVGCHVSGIIDVLKKAWKSSSRNRFEEFSEQDLERLRVLGFLWERAMIEEDDTQSGVIALPLDPDEREIAWERAMSRHAVSVRSEPGLSFPGEMMYCDQCEITMPGGDIGREHCKSRGHKGVFFTVDGVMTPPRRRYGIKEWKYTNLSAARTGETHMDELKEWLVQVMWYALMIDADYAEIDAMFARGDYTTKRPVMLPFRFHIELDDPRELQRNKTMLLSTARSEGII